jgi:hypothetical protein
MVLALDMVVCQVLIITITMTTEATIDHQIEARANMVVV